MINRDAYKGRELPINPVDQAEAIRLCYKKGYSRRKVAEIMGKPLYYTNRLINRGLRDGFDIYGNGNHY